MVKLLCTESHLSIDFNIVCWRLEFLIAGMGRSFIWCSSWALDYLRNKKMFDAKFKLDRGEWCDGLIMSAMGRSVRAVWMPGICHSCLKASFYPLISQLSVLIILLVIKSSICTLIYSSIYCYVPVDVMMSEKSTGPQGAHSIQTEKHSSKSINQYSLLVDQG